MHVPPHVDTVTNHVGFWIFAYGVVLADGAIWAIRHLAL